VRVLAVRPRVTLALQPYLPYPNSCQGTSPHQQGRGAKVSEPYYVGIDVSIDRLDVAIPPGGRGFCVKFTARFANCERFSDLLDGAWVQPARHDPFIRLQQMTALALIPAARGTEIERQGSGEAV